MKMLPYIKIPLIYSLFGALWVFFSDNALNIMVDDVEIMTELQTYKGWLYVLLTSLLIYFLIKRDYEKHVQREQEKRNVFTATMSASHHVLNNFMNQMQLFKEEAKECESFSRDILNVYDQVMDDAQQQLSDLGSTTELTKEAITNSIYPK